MGPECIVKVFPWVLMASVVSASAAPVRPRVEQLEQSIRQASEAGNFSGAQALHKEIAEYCAEALDYACAVRHYELLLAGRPRRRERIGYFIQLGKMRYAMQDYSGAIVAYQDALHDDDKEYDAVLALARTYDKIDLSSKAVEQYQRARSLRPRDLRPILELAGLYVRIGYLEKAVDTYQKAQAMAPSAEATLGISDCFIRRDDLMGAIRALDEGKDYLTPAEYSARRGDINERLGDGMAAAEFWEDAIRHDAKRSDIRLKLMLLYDRLQRRTESDRLFHQLIVEYPESPLVHFWRAWVLYGRGDRQGSRREALTVQKLSPSEGVQHFNERLLLLLKK